MNRKLSNTTKTLTIPKQLGGFGYGQYGKQARMGNRVYDSEAVAVCLTAEPLGNRGGYSSMYLEEVEDE